MSILDFGNFDDDAEDDQGRRERFEDELRKYRDSLKDGSQNLTNAEAIEEIVNYYFDNEKYEEALHFVTQLLAIVPYSPEFSAPPRPRSPRHFAARAPSSGTGRG